MEMESRERYENKATAYSNLTNDLKSIFENQQRVTTYLNLAGELYPSYANEAKNWNLDSLNCTVFFHRRHLEVVRTRKIIGPLRKKDALVLYRINYMQLAELNFQLLEIDPSNAMFTLYLDIATKNGGSVKLAIPSPQAAVALYNSPRLKNITKKVPPELESLLQKNNSETIKSDLQKLTTIPHAY